MLFGHTLQRSELIDACVVNEDIEPAEGVMGLSEQASNVSLTRHIGLHRNGLSARVLDFVDQLCSGHFAGSIIHDDGGICGRQMPRDGRANALRRARNDGNLALKFPGWSHMLFVLVRVIFPFSVRSDRTKAPVLASRQSVPMLVT